jgi:hypothetical protein
MVQLVLGLGEVGRAVKEVTGSEYSYDIKDDTPNLPAGIDMLHICYPYSPTFIEAAQDDIERFRPKHTIVWSTVPIGTCRKVSDKVVHSPIEGVHPDLAKSIRKMRRWVGFNDGTAGRMAVKYFEDLGLRVWIVSSTEMTELAKLRSTAKYGINLVWTQYESELCGRFGVPFDELMTYDQDYNELFTELDEWKQRYVLYPPNGRIGGHCVVPNAKLLNEQFPSDLLDKIIAMGEK